MFIIMSHRLYSSHLQAVTLPLSLSDGKWHHVCLTWSTRDGQWEAYQDGVQRGSGTNLSPWHPIKPGGVFILGQEQVMKTQLIPCKCRQNFTKHKLVSDFNFLSQGAKEGNYRIQKSDRIQYPVCPSFNELFVLLHACICACMLIIFNSHLRTFIHCFLQYTIIIIIIKLYKTANFTTNWPTSDTVIMLLF